VSDTVGRSLLRTVCFALLYVATTYAGRLTIAATGNEAGGSRMTFTLPMAAEPLILAA
jgi:hypothetical protein